MRCRLRACLLRDAAHPAPHSFPTRRSSDLSVLIGPDAFKGGVSTEMLGILMHFGVAFAWSAVFLLAVTQSPQLRDRKSTRLNSSHGYISYAVFCLKKKTHRHY